MEANLVCKNTWNLNDLSLFQYSATSWEMAFQEYMSANANRLSGLKITWFSSLTREVEFEKFIVPSVVPYFW